MKNRRVTQTKSTAEPKAPIRKPAWFDNSMMTVWNPTEAGAKQRRMVTADSLAGKVLTVPKVTEPKARREKPADYAKRLEKAVDHDELKVEHLIGSSANGWKLVTTDGHRAVLLRVEGDPAKKFPKGMTEWPTLQVTLDDPELFNAVRRMRAANPGSKRNAPRTTLTLIPESQTAGRLTLSTWDREDGTKASEWLDVTGVNFTQAEASIDTRYLQDALGVWPATLRLGSSDKPTWICTADTRYVVMPFGGDVVKKVEVPYETWTELPEPVAPVAETPAPPVRAKKVKAPAAVPERLTYQEADSFAVGETVYYTKGKTTGVIRELFRIRKGDILRARLSIEDGRYETHRPTSNLRHVSATDAPTVSVKVPRSVAPPAGQVLTAGQKAALTRKLRIESGQLKVDYHAAARKAVETRRQRLQAA